MKFSQEMPTCSNCPFFKRQAGQTLEAPGECLYSLANSIPVPAPQGVTLIPGATLTFYHKTCHNHPAMADWLTGVYLKEYRLSSNGDAAPPRSDGLKPDLILRP